KTRRTSTRPFSLFSPPDVPQAWRNHGRTKALRRRNEDAPLGAGRRPRGAHLEKSHEVQRTFSGIDHSVRLGRNLEPPRPAQENPLPANTIHAGGAEPRRRISHAHQSRSFHRSVTRRNSGAPAPSSDLLRRPSGKFRFPCRRRSL